MIKANISRRNFLRSSGKTAAAAVAFSIAGVQLPKTSWAMTVSNLSLHEGKTLVDVCRVLYPHDTLGDMYYAACIEALDDKAAQDKALAKTLKDGVAALDKKKSSPFRELKAKDQLALIQEIEGSDLFNAVRGHTVVALYNNPLVWRHFGYEGASYPHGGYLERGFNDIHWLNEE